MESINVVWSFVQIFIICLINSFIVIFVLKAILKKKNNESDIEEIVGEMSEDVKHAFKEEMNHTKDLVLLMQNEMNNNITEKISAMDSHINQKQEMMNTRVSESIARQEERIKTFSLENEQRLENIRATVEKSLYNMQSDNNRKLEEMRIVVDEKLQKSLDEKMNKSFSMVSERLEQVYKGLGEMQTLASGVGDLKKVLSNVKTRGIVGEIQLGAILQEILSHEQYEENVAVVPGSQNRVEFAVKLPGNDGTVYLPIDSKFPGDTYAALQYAYDLGDKTKIDDCVKTLLKTIQSEAKDISTKYIAPPHTTEFAIMFLPFEGLYSEVVNRGMVEKLQKDYRVNIAGPSTMAALLNSLQMGFKTLAIQKRSSEVWQVLSAVKTEFDTFSTILEKTKTKLENANKDLDTLVGVRTRAINRKLKEVSTLDSKEAHKLIGVEDFEE